MTTLLISAMPMKSEPIDWAEIVDVGEKLALTLSDTVDGTVYLFSSVFEGDNYSTGYSSLNVTGKKQTV